MKTKQEVENLLDSLLESARPPGGAGSEISYVQRQSRTVSWADGRPNLQEAADTEGVCLRVLREGGQGVLTTRTLDAAHFRELASEAVEMARVSPVDPHRKFAKAGSRYPDPPDVEANFFAKSVDGILKELADLEQVVLKIDPRLKKVVKFQVSESRSMSGLANSHGLRLAAPSSSVTFVAEILAEDGGETEVAWDFQSRRFVEGWKLEPIADAVARHAAESLGGKPVPSGKYAVVVHPRVGAQLLDLLSKALSAESVQLGRSFLAGARGRPAASELVTLIDDPLLPDGVASGSFDDEGTPHQTCAMVSSGALLDYFYDLRSASKEGRESNGHGIKESLGAAPRPGPTNFYMQKGGASFEAMAQSAQRVFHLRDVMGLHMADPVTGEFSLGASGFLYEKGARSRPVRGVTIAGSLADIFKSVASVGDDLTWYGSIGSPSFLLPHVTIAGN